MIWQGDKLSEPQGLRFQDFWARVAGRAPQVVRLYMRWGAGRYTASVGTGNPRVILWASDPGTTHASALDALDHYLRHLAAACWRAARAVELRDQALGSPEVHRALAIPTPQAAPPGLELRAAVSPLPGDGAHAERWVSRIAAGDPRVLVWTSDPYPAPGEALFSLCDALKQLARLAWTAAGEDVDDLPSKEICECCAKLFWAETVHCPRCAS